MDDLPSLRELGHKMEVVYQTGNGGPQMKQAQNGSALYGFGTDQDGHDKIICSTDVVLYSHTDGFGRRRRVSSYPERLVESMRDGFLEDHLSRTDYILSTEVRQDLSGLNMPEVIVYVGKF